MREENFAFYSYQPEVIFSKHSQKYTGEKEIDSLDPMVTGDNTKSFEYSLLLRQLIHWDTFKQDKYSIVGGDGRCRLGKVRADNTSPVPNHKGHLCYER